MLDHRGQLDQLDSREQLGLKVTWVHQGLRDLLGQRVPQALQELKDLREILDRQDQQDRQETWGQADNRDHLDLRETLVVRDQQDR